MPRIIHRGPGGPVVGERIVYAMTPEAERELADARGARDVAVSELDAFMKVGVAADAGASVEPRINVIEKTVVHTDPELMKRIQTLEALELKHAECDMYLLNAVSGAAEVAAKAESRAKQFRRNATIAAAVLLAAEVAACVLALR